MNSPVPVRRGMESPWSRSLALTFRFLFLLVYVLGFVWLVSNARMIPTDSRAVVLRFGTVNREHGPGLLLALPEPFEKVLQLPSADRQNEFPIRALQDAYAMVEPNPRLNIGMFLTGDMSAVRLNATLFFQITDARAYVLSQQHVEAALNRLFFASAVKICGSRDLDTILVARPELETSEGSGRIGRERLRAQVAEEINRRLDDLTQQGASLGVAINRVDLVPSIPTEAETAFSSVLVAIQTAETHVAEARTNAEQTAQRANQEKDRVVTEAQAQASERKTLAETRTSAILALSKNAQNLTGRSLENQVYAEKIGPILHKAARVQTVGDDGAHVVIPAAGSP